MHAALDVATRMPRPRLVVAGHSLGGNFALRLALRAPAAGLPLDAVAAVCPVLDPGRTMEAMERGLPLYLRHFERSWRRSLVRKRALFPGHVGFDDTVLRLRMRALTEWLVLRHTDFGSLEGYFDRYPCGEAWPDWRPDFDPTSADDRCSRSRVPQLMLPEHAHLNREMGRTLRLIEVHRAAAERWVVRAWQRGLSAGYNRFSGVAPAGHFPCKHDHRPCAAAIHAALEAARSRRRGARRCRAQRLIALALRRAPT